MVGDVLQPGGDEHERRVPVREGADHPRASPDLAVYPLDAVIGPDSAPVLRWEIGVGQGHPEAVAHGPRRGGEPHPLELAGDSHRLAGACPARLPCVDRLGHASHRLPLRHRDPAEHVAVEMHGAAPVPCVREDLLEGAEHARAPVPDDRADAREAAPLEPGEEPAPRAGGLGVALRAADNLCFVKTI